MAAKNDGLLETCELYMQMLDGPIHYKQLARDLLDTGVWDGSGAKEPDQVLYSRLKNDIGRRGADSAFRFMGGGVFCASTVKAVDEVAERVAPPARTPYDPEKPRRKPGETQGEFDARIERGKAPRTCGDCSHMFYSDAAHLRGCSSGVCESDDSDRVTAFPGDEACPHWSRRTERQWSRDSEDRHMVIAMASSTAGGRLPLHETLEQIRKLRR